MADKIDKLALSVSTQNGKIGDRDGAAGSGTEPRPDLTGANSNEPPLNALKSGSVDREETLNRGGFPEKLGAGKLWILASPESRPYRAYGAIILGKFDVDGPLSIVSLEQEGAIGDREDERDDDGDDWPRGVYD
jgi:hypothetical protein